VDDDELVADAAFLKKLGGTLGASLTILSSALV
jgi:hypothetical protein